MLKRLNSKAPGITVSTGLQAAFVAIIGLSMLVSLAFTLYLSGAFSNSFDRSNDSYAVYSLVVTLFPLLVLLVALVLQPRMPWLGRLFMAGLHTLLVTTAFYTASSLRHYTYMLVADPVAGNSKQPPYWLLSNVPDYILMLLCLLVYMVLMLRLRKRA